MLTPVLLSAANDDESGRDMENSRREQILAAAVKVFERDGFRKATLDDIGVEAKASKSLIFYHYKNKFALLALMYKRVGELLIGDITEIVESDRLTPAEKIGHIIRSHVRIAIENLEIFRIYFRERHEIPPDIQESLIGKGERRYISAVERIISEGVELGLFSDVHPRTMAYSIIGACNWVTMWYVPKKGGRGSMSHGDIAIQIERMALSGLLMRHKKK